MIEALAHYLDGLLGHEQYEMAPEVALLELEVDLDEQSAGPAEPIDVQQILDTPSHGQDLGRGECEGAPELIAQSIQHRAQQDIADVQQQLLLEHIVRLGFLE